MFINDLQEPNTWNYGMYLEEKLSMFDYFKCFSHKTEKQCVNASSNKCHWKQSSFPIKQCVGSKYCQMSNSINECQNRPNCNYKQIDVPNNYCVNS